MRLRSITSLLLFAALAPANALAWARPPAPAHAPAPPAVAPDAPPPPTPPGFTQGFSFSFGRGRLGVSVTSMTEELRAFFGAARDRGVLVQRVETDSPAAKAGVRVGDVIVAVDGDAVSDVGDIVAALSDREANDTVELELVRDKKRRQLRAELADDGGAVARWHGGSLQLPDGALELFDDERLRSRLEQLEQQLRVLEQRLDALEPGSHAPRAPKARPTSPTKPRDPRGRMPRAAPDRT